MEALSEKELQKVGEFLNVDNIDNNEKDIDGINIDNNNNNNNFDDDLERAVTNGETLSKSSKVTIRSNVAPSEISRASNKTYISHLES